MNFLNIVNLFYLLLGVGIGYGITKVLSPDRKARAQMEEELSTARQNHENYQSEVRRHFIKTASMVNEVSHSYHALYEHLAKSSANLCTPDLAQQFLPGEAMGNQSPGQSTISPASAITASTTQKPAEPPDATPTPSAPPSRTRPTATSERTGHDAPPKAPQDYSQETSGKSGTLAEDFGLKTEREEPPATKAANPSSGGTLAEDFGLRPRTDDDPTTTTPAGTLPADKQS